MSQDYYEILGVSRSATPKEIKRAYKQLARKYHPDVAEDKEQAEKKFQDINRAYGVLSSEESRAQYDRFGHDAFEQAAGGGGFGGGGFSDFGGFSDIFESIFDFGGGRSRRSRGGPTRGADMKQVVEITLEESFEGAEIEVPVSGMVTCDGCDGKRTQERDGVKACGDCQGTGQLHQVIQTPLGRMTQVGPCGACRGTGQVVIKPCLDCRGAGIVEKTRTISTTLPKGIDQGSMMRVRGEGGAGSLGGPPGDLYLVIQIKPHERLQRQKEDLFLTLRLKFTEAALGDSVEVEGIAGEKHQLKIPVGTQNNKIFKISKAGMPHLHGNTRGDLQVIASVMVPTDLNAEQKRLLKEFAQAGSQEAKHHEPNLFERLKDAIFG